MPEKTVDHAKGAEVDSKHPVADIKVADTAAARHPAVAAVETKPHAPKIEAPEFPSPVPSSDPAAFWPEDGPVSAEAPPRDQVWPPTDRQANRGQVAVPETYRTPDGYLVTKHPAANAMATKSAAVNELGRALGVTPEKPRSTEITIPTGDLDAQMDAKREAIRVHERAIANERAELDLILRHKNQNPK